MASWIKSKCFPWCSGTNKGEITWSSGEEIQSFSSRNHKLEFFFSSSRNRALAWLPVSLASVSPVGGTPNGAKCPDTSCCCAITEAGPNQSSADLHSQTKQRQRNDATAQLGASAWWRWGGGVWRRSACSSWRPVSSWLPSFYWGITASIRRMNTNEAANAAHNLVSGTISMRHLGWFPLRAPLFFLFLFFFSSSGQPPVFSSPDVFTRASHLPPPPLSSGASVLRRAR